MTALSPELQGIVDRYDDLTTGPFGNVEAKIARLYEAIQRFKDSQDKVDTRWAGLSEDLRAILNKHSVDSMTNTPDFILAALIVGFIKAYRLAIDDNMKWHGDSPIGGVNAHGG